VIHLCEPVEDDFVVLVNDFFGPLGTTRAVNITSGGPSQGLHTPSKGGLKQRRPMWCDGMEQRLSEGSVPTHIN
jgi:hypothetical protein